MEPLTFLANVALALILKTEEPVLKPQVDGVAYDALVVAWRLDHPVAFKGMQDGDRRLLTASLGVVASYREARFSKAPKGSNDKMSACGTMQVHAPFLKFGSCEDARADRQQGFLEGMSAMVKAIEDCNPGKSEFTATEVIRGLGAYATGTCGHWRDGATDWCRKARVCK